MLRASGDVLSVAVYLRCSFEWMQSSERLGLTFFVKNLSPEDIRVVDFKAREFRLCFLIPPSNPQPPDATGQAAERQVFDFHIEHLLDDIVPEECKYTVGPVGFEVRLLSPVS